MTNITQNFAAAIAAIAIVAATWMPVITVPTAQAATLIAPVLA